MSMPEPYGGQRPDPDADQPVLLTGPAPEEAPATLILLHGRGAPAWVRSLG